uniref:tRNA/rRNA methyltransferase SpoU type domain-containing protein n=2 Tax=Tetranychus urticae TaxID=32264 RepID=T1JQI6_TETUR
MISRKILNVLDSEGNPLYSETEIPSEKKYNVEKLRDKKRFNAKAYAGYVRDMSLKDVQQCRFDNRITYVPINNKHPDFTRAVLIIRGTTPEKKSFIALEGKNIIRDALNCGMKLDKLFFTSEHLLKGIPELERVLAAAQLGEYKDHGPVILKVTPNMMNRMTTVETPPGLIAIFAKPTMDQESSATRSCCLPITVIGDNIRDPGNMGALIRSSAAIGVEMLICTKGSVNPWESKVVRSGVGAHFRVNLLTDFMWSNLPSILPPTDSTLFFAEKVGIRADKSEFSTSKTIEDKNYFDIDYSSFIKNDKKLCVIIGGETQGISDEAMDISKIYNSYKVNIPIMKGIDSLNSAIAGSVILFEIQRQIIKNLS